MVVSVWQQPQQQLVRHAVATDLASLPTGHSTAISVAVWVACVFASCVCASAGGTLVTDGESRQH